ncbi:uncharacterized protein LOC143286798 [Babylonia areolata]|uniref:uncharacterized protein LOC143286798 n=1 Tax=Babylonia areolata TaxID=304850 RepID=UPI003FCFC838
MEGKALGVVLLAGLGLLAGSARADSHGGGMVPEGCNGTDVRQCFTPFMGSGVLVPYASGNKTLIDEAAEVAAANPQIWRQVCGAAETAVSCLRPAEAKCLSESQAANFTDLLHLDFKVPTVADTLHLWESLCTNYVYCGSIMQNCSSSFADIIPVLNAGQANLSDPNLCRSAQELQHCLVRDIPVECRSVYSVRKAGEGIRLATGYCAELRCQELQHCREDFMEGGPVPVGLNDKTCFLYRNFTKCAGNAKANCADLPSVPGEPSPSQVSEVIDQACTAMAQDGISAIYTCTAFTTCISVATQKLGPSPDTLFLPHVCKTVQNVMGCALHELDKCSGLNVSMKAAFKSQVTALALRTEAMGCGTARVVTDSCTDLEPCLNAYANNQQWNFDGMCNATHTFQSCAGGIVESCNLTGPATPPAGGMRMPRLAALSSTTEGLCSAMRNQTILGCDEFNDCLGGYALDLPKNGWEMINSGTWCRLTIQMMECARRARTCTMSDSLRNSVRTAYRAFLNLGCRDAFDFKSEPENQPTTTPKPTGGAPSLAGVSLIGMLLLACLSRL